MIRQQIVFKTGDTAAAQNLQLTDRDKAPVVLTAATAVMQVKGHDAEIACTLVDAATGIVSPGRGTLAPATGKDVKTFEAEIEVTFSDGTIQTYPEDGYFEVKVWSELDP